MSNYGKLKVTDLKEELGRRNLPKSGLKAELVKRLVEADAAAQQQEEDAAADVDDVTEAAEVGGASGESDRGDELEPPSNSINGHGERSEESHIAITAEGLEVQGNEPHTQDQQHEQMTGQPASAMDADTQSEILPGVLTQPIHIVEPQLPTPAQTQLVAPSSPMDVSHTSTQTTVALEEMAEDTRKRKRRSRSPPPSSPSKRLKPIEEGESGSQDPYEGVPVAPSSPPSQRSPKIASFPQKEVPNNNASVGKTSEREDAAVLTTEENVTAPNRDTGLVQHHGTNQRPPSVPEAVEAEDQAVVKSPPDARFKGLLNDADSAQTAPDRLTTTREDREVSPSIHPATSALYIRELMRPLNPRTLKDHLAKLASSGEALQNESPIVEFFLDSIRSHCLVSFRSVAAAARVRSAMHDRVWPDERDRRPLWADFIPEDKVKEWSNQEDVASASRGQGMKRWEVIYEGGQGNVQALLQEVGTGIAGTREPSKAGPDTTARGDKTEAPAHQPGKAIPVPAGDPGKGFKALDDLFQSTAAKPKIYFLPAQKKEALRRLELLRAGHGGGKSDEMRRFSFEEETVVDKGPEYGNRGRGGFRGGRGRGYEDSHRGRGGRFAPPRHEGYRYGGDRW